MNGLQLNWSVGCPMFGGVFFPQEIFYRQGLCGELGIMVLSGFGRTNGSLKMLLHLPYHLEGGFGEDALVENLILIGRSEGGRQVWYLNFVGGQLLQLFVNCPLGLSIIMIDQSGVQLHIESLL